MRRLLIYFVFIGFIQLILPFHWQGTLAYPYIVLLLLIPLQLNALVFFLICTLIGSVFDVYYGVAAYHTLAVLTAGLIRNIYLHATLSKYPNQLTPFNVDISLYIRLSFFLVLVHQTVYYLAENFGLTHFSSLLSNILIGGLFSWIYMFVLWFLIGLISRRE